MKKRFVTISIILSLIILVSEYIVYASLHDARIIKSQQLETILMVLGFVFPIIFIFSIRYSYRHYSLINSWLNVISSIWILIVSYLFIVYVFITILIFSNSFFNLKLNIEIIYNTFFIGVLITTLYGILNSRNIKIVRVEIDSDKLRKHWSDKKIIIISDTHIGNINRVRFMKKIVKIMKSENPDIVFNVGDLIDGAAFPYKECFEPLSFLDPGLGSYYVEGNHETYSKDYKKFRLEFPKNLVDLTGKKIIMNGTQIIGLGYKERESSNEIISRLKSLEYNSEMPSIILVHDPKNIEAISSLGATLVLSGHTHNGQFFPFTIIIKRLYKKYSHGVAYTNNTASITSCGVGTSVVPMRIGTTPEIIVLKIK